MLNIAGRIISFLVWFGFAILITLLLIVPTASSIMLNLGYTPSTQTERWLRFLQQAQTPAMRLFCLAWVFFLGSCFASFLNVVAWRVPRGKSILGSSHCPDCNVTLKFPFTNLPILGWLRNGGCCANCDAPIPVRYLVAELVLGATFLILFVLQTTTGGGTIPFRPLNTLQGIEHNLFSPQADLLTTLAFHLTILSLIFTLAIAATEKFSAPLSLVAFGMIATIGFHCFSPAIGMVDFRFGEWNEGVASNHYLKALESPTDFLIAVALGIVTAAACFAAIRFSNHSRPFGSFACLLLIGIAFGWQAVLSVCVLTCLLLPIVRFNVSGIIFVATLLHLCLWRLQTSCAWWPGPASGPPQLICGVAYIALLAATYRYLAFMCSKPTTEPQADLPISKTDLE